VRDAARPLSTRGGGRRGGNLEEVKRRCASAKGPTLTRRSPGAGEGRTLEEHALRLERSGEHVVVLEQHTLKLQRWAVKASAGLDGTRSLAPACQGTCCTGG